MRLRLTACTLLIALAVAGCSGADKTMTPPATEVAQTSSLSFEVVTENRLPTELGSWKTATSGQTQIQGGSIAHQRVGDHLYIAVIGGEQPTGGYRVEVGQVKLTSESKRDLVSLEAKLTGPAPGTATTQAITYPRAYIRVPYEASKRAPVVEGSLQVGLAGADAKDATTKAVLPLPAPAQQPAKEPPATAPKADPTPAVKPQQPQGAVQFQAVDERQLPTALRSWGGGIRGEAGAAAEVVDGVLYVKVEAGEQRTGGYRVEIRKVELVGGEVKVQAVLHRPAPGAMVTQALTYPKAFAKATYQGSGAVKAQVEWVR